MKTKICTKCGVEKGLDEFHNDQCRKDGKVSHCKKCISLYTKKYRNENKESIKIAIQKCYLKDRDNILEYKKQWYNKPINKIKNRLNGLYRQQISRSGLEKPKENIFDIMKISPGEYLSYFEKLDLFNDYFERNDINLDHLIPISAYNASNRNDIKKCWNPENMRFIKKLENEKKHNKIDMELIKKHNIEHLLPEGLTVQ